jgi:hypothetical protein
MTRCANAVGAGVTALHLFTQIYEYVSDLAEVQK